MGIERKKYNKEYQKGYARKPEIKEKNRKRNRYDTIAARDPYIKALIREKTQGVLPTKDIPQELIELQRQSLMLKREIAQKQQQNEQRNSTNI